jgi:integrase/recombinase XerD
MQFQDHDNFPEFDHRALPPANGSSIGESARRPAFQGMPWKAGRHENWGIFNRHIWGVYVRHSQELRTALVGLRQSPTQGRPSSFVINTERAARTSPQAIVNLFSRWYADLGFSGCSSHSGRRTFITTAARKISTVGGSLRDVQMLAGHSNLSTTQRYIEAHAEAQRRIVELL